MLARRLARLEARQPARPDALPPDLQHLPADLRALLAYIGEHGERIGE